MSGNGMLFGPYEVQASNLQAVNDMLRGVRSTDPNAFGVSQSASPQVSASADDPNTFWGNFKMALSGRQGGQVTEESLGRRNQLYGSMENLGSRFQNVGGGPIAPLPRGYVGPGTTLGQNQGIGLQQLIAMILRGGV